jgi:hypothetical protein
VAWHLVQTTRKSFAGQFVFANFDKAFTELAEGVRLGVVQSESLLVACDCVLEVLNLLQNLPELNKRAAQLLFLGRQSLFFICR